MQKVVSTHLVPNPILRVVSESPLVMVILTRIPASRAIFILVTISWSFISAPSTEGLSDVYILYIPLHTRLCQLFLPFYKIPPTLSFSTSDTSTLLDLAWMLSPINLHFSREFLICLILFISACIAYG